MQPGESVYAVEDLASRDVEAVLRLNNANAVETSELDRPGLAALLDMSFYARGIDRGATALLIALDHKAAYVNPNFAWFKAARESFVYIDRVVVSDAARGQGIARLLYTDLFAAAKRTGHRRVVCEVNVDPPNPASDAFHASMGFAEIGRASIHGGKKTVRYFEKILD